jgi:hypothetical protein
MQKLPMMVYLAREVCVVLLGRLEYNLINKYRVSVSKHRMRARALELSIYLRTVCKLVRSKIDLPERPLSDKLSECIVSNGTKVIRRELARGRFVRSISRRSPVLRVLSLLEKFLVRVGKL